MNYILIILIISLNYWKGNLAVNSDAERLYDDLMNGYNSFIRPVINNSDRLTVKMGLRLSQLIDVNLKNQIMTVNVWVEQEWTDYKLRWDPDEYGGVMKLHVPSEQIWLPDIILYNNADGHYDVTIMTKAIVHHDGTVVWKPPAIFKSACLIDVTYFPFDEQTCHMKFGSWTYDGYTIELKHKWQRGDAPLIEKGMDLSEFYLSVEWDIMSVPALMKNKYYTCCEEPFPDITFNITMRRKTLFYTVNLILPCVIISGMSVLVFYLPCDSGEKMSLSISIVLSLGVFFLLLSEIIPPTSLAIPLLGRYLIFTLVLVTLSVAYSIVVLNVNYRSPSTHKLSPRMRRLFLEVLPRILGMSRPVMDNESIISGSTGRERRHRSLSEVTEKGHLALTSAISQGLRRLSSQTNSDDFPLPPTPPKDKISTGRMLLAPVTADGPPLSTLPFVHPNGGPPTDIHLPSIASAPGVIPSSYLTERVEGSVNGNRAEDRPFPREEVGEDSSSSPSRDSSGSSSSTSSPSSSTPSTLSGQPGGMEGGIGNRRKEVFEHALLSVRFVAQHMENLDGFEEIGEDWKYVALVLDRLFLYIFLTTCILGTCWILLQAPTLYDSTQPIDILLSKVGRRMRHLPELVIE